jgi:hypothetical protein
MKLKCLVIIAALVSFFGAHAQTPLEKSIPVQSGQRINMHFDYPDLIRVSTWDKNEIQVKGTVSINSGENDDAFQMESSVNGNTIDLRATIRDIKRLPQRITIRREDGTKIIFKNKEELRKYQDANGKDYHSMSWGADIDIELTIFVPKNVDTRIESVYGMVEVKGFVGPLTVEAKYGGIDASVTERATGEITAETNYGEIFTNLDAKFGGNGYNDRDFHTYVKAKPGTGPNYAFESQYGNVYIRKAVTN